MAKPRSLIAQAKERREQAEDTGASKAEQEAIPLYMAGQYEQAIALLEPVSDLSEEGKAALIWSYFGHGKWLADQANTKSGDEADQLFEAAGLKYEQVFTINPSIYAALNNWGGTLLFQVATKSGADQAELLRRAVAILERGEALGSKDVLYNLACAHARLGDNAKAERYLRESKQHGRLPDRAEIDSEADFDAVRGQAWFKELLDELAPGG